MPRWYALCHGLDDFPACATCRRHVSRNGAHAAEPQQHFVTPDLVGDFHCNRYIETPAHSTAAITPTDTRS